MARSSARKSTARFRGNALALLLLTLAADCAQSYETRLTVALDGSGDFRTIQAAIDAAKSFPEHEIQIRIAPGLYVEKVVAWGWNTRLSLLGAGADRTIIRWDDYFERIDRGRNSTFHTATLRVEGNDFHAADLAIENTAGPVGQAIALSVDADRALFERVLVRGHQDTLYVTGENRRVLFRECRVEGTVDFIFGGALAVFERCEIRSRGDGYITAASTPAGQAAGLVFIDSRLTAEPGIDTVYLGRPWRLDAQAAFLRCEMGAHIVPAGWNDWDKPEAHQRSVFAEYLSRGPGGAPDDRVDWSRQLDADQAERFEVERLLARPGERDWFRPRTPIEATKADGRQ